MASIKEQVAANLEHLSGGSYAVCLEESNRHNGWLFYKHPDGQWVSLHQAEPIALMQAQIRLENMKVILGIS